MTGIAGNFLVERLFHSRDSGSSRAVFGRRSSILFFTA
jgi:hypothetical protein